MSGLTANVSSKPYQSGFLTSLERFPAMIAGWGTGKTMCAILKGRINSRAFKNNLGLIVRKNFTDLRDSTLKDFELYTGIKVPQHTKEIVDENGSVTMFRHGDELSGLQNVNLGWAYIEQAEEFDSDDTFGMLRGRLRRKLEPDVSIWSDPSFKVGPVHRPFIEKLQELKPQQLFLIANANGHNWCWEYWIRGLPAVMSDLIYEEMSRETKVPVEELKKLSSSDQYKCFQATTFDNRDNLPDSFISDMIKLKTENPQKYEQYVMNSHEAFDLIGSFFASQMSQALIAKRIGPVPYDPMAKVFTFWDIGDIYTAIWFVQFQGPQIKLIDFYYDNKGQGIPFYSKVLMEKGYNYGEHWVGPDLDPEHGGNRKSMHTGKYTIDIAKEHNIKFKVVFPHDVDDRIKASADLISQCWFDEKKCSEGIDGLIHFRKKRNDADSTKDHIVYHKTPIDGWTRHIADAFGHLAMAHRYLNITGQRFGRSSQDAPIRRRQKESDSILTRGLHSKVLSQGLKKVV